MACALRSYLRMKDARMGGHLLDRRFVGRRGSEQRWVQRQTPGGPATQSVPPPREGQGRITPPVRRQPCLPHAYPTFFGPGPLLVSA